MAKVAKVRHTTQAIETLRAGDLILARDQWQADAPLNLQRIEEVFKRTAYQLTLVTLRSSVGEEQTLCTTNEHPVYVPGRGWVVCRELEAGDDLLEPTGSVSRVVGTRHERHPQGIAVHNFRVAESHTYFVREAGSDVEPVWVHNGCGADDVAESAGQGYGAAARDAVDASGEGIGAAPDQVQPGIRQLSGNYVSPNRAQPEPWTAEYDDYGRQIARTDYTNQPDPATHTNPHYHTREYGIGYGKTGYERGPFPGEYPGGVE